MIEQIKQYLRQPQTWTIAIPALLALLLFYSFFQMNSTRNETEFQTRNAQQSVLYASGIQNLLKQMGRESITGSAVKNFNGISSALECARAANLTEENFPRGESSKNTSQQDGANQHRETYKISRVSLLQIAQFIDHAERDYSDLQCTKLTLVPMTGANTRDSWSATLTIRYSVK